MPSQKINIRTNRLLVSKTRQTLAHWHRLLNKRVTQKKARRKIFKLFSGTDGITLLGQRQMPAVWREHNPFLKESNRTSHGNIVSVSKTIAVPVGRIYDAFVQEKLRRVWLKEKIRIDKTVKNKSAHLIWRDMPTQLKVDFQPVIGRKARVVVRHTNITDPEAATAIKSYWREKLGRLKSYLEK